MFKLAPLLAYAYVFRMASKELTETHRTMVQEIQVWNIVFVYIEFRKTIFKN